MVDSAGHIGFGPDKLQKLIKTALSNGLWDRITAVKSIESQKAIQELTEQQQKMDKRQNELRKCLATAYKDKVKGVMDGDPFVLPSNQFKERDQLQRSTTKNPGKIGDRPEIPGQSRTF